LTADDRSSIEKIEEWFGKWNISNSKKLSSEEARKALQELADLVENYSVFVKKKATLLDDGGGVINGDKGP
jgi:hypothetical protein